MLRGFLVGFGLIVALSLLFVWFALPPILGGVAVGMLRDAGLRAEDIRVDVSADPPLRLIGLDADRVRVRATGVEIETLRAESVDLTLREVSLRDRTFEVIEGRIESATLTPTQGPTIRVSTVRVSGPPEAALMSMTLSEDDVAAIVRSTVARAFGLEATDVTLQSPDRLTFRTGGESIGGRLRVDGSGGLVFTDDRGQITLDLFRSTASDPAVLRSARVEGGSLEVTGTLNVLADR
ncbi:MAG: hypothetical protein FJ038_10605 [Chloroflexi bacterium]|nr:hypothetical protein [Chloroflexota bacterium]